MNLRVFITKAPSVLRNIATGMTWTQRALCLCDCSGLGLTIILLASMGLRMLANAIEMAGERGWVEC